MATPSGSAARLASRTALVTCIFPLGCAAARPGANVCASSRVTPDNIAKSSGEEIRRRSSDAPASMSASTTSTFPLITARYSGGIELASSASSDAPVSISALTNSTFSDMMASISGVKFAFASSVELSASRSASTVPARAATFGEANHT
eukprot:scaffold16563_cov66-Phaeocystis_antarctica.AAC.2